MNGDANYTFDLWEALIRLLKYAIEALFVALAAYLLPKQKLPGCWLRCWFPISRIPRLERWNNLII